MHIQIEVAQVHHLSQLTHLINSAYRGEDARGGWTHEADLIDGTLRTDEATLLELMKDPASVFLLCFSDGQLCGCVHLQKHDDYLYLGMLSVDPQRQGSGIGKVLLRAADEHARKLGIPRIRMTVISVRRELIDWYHRRGYSDTGLREPFPDDGRFGTPRQPLEFAILEKAVEEPGVGSS